jgi:hypothetical protein
MWLPGPRKTPKGKKPQGRQSLLDEGNLFVRRRLQDGRRLWRGAKGSERIPGVHHKISGNPAT